MIKKTQTKILNNTFQKIPFLRLTIALAFGVFIGSFVQISTVPLIALSGLLYFFLLILNRYYKFQVVSLFGISTQLLFIVIGILVFEIHNKRPVFAENGIFIGTVLEKPQEKKNSYKSVIQLLSVKNGDTILQTNEKILVYFEKGESATNLNPGDNIAFKTSLQIIKNYGNPFEFDYKKYLANKKIYRQVYLSSENWKKTNLPAHFSVYIFAENIREKLLLIYRQQQLGRNELEILSALTLGYKRGLDPETKRIFSAAGAMHVLAVSGLHVGIIFWVITLLFGFLRKQKSGKFLFVILSICLLWVYAFITGLSPSVMRAAAMFSIFVIGDNLNRKANTYNSLAASALFLLLFNPNNLFEVGFQLSYSAVFGIVFLQPKLSKLLPVKNKFVRFFWTLLTVSIAAQIATFPLTTFYFNQFPTYFWITNIIIIPAVMILIPLGMGLLLFSKISIVSNLISAIIQLLIKGCFFILTKIEQLPFSIQEISIHPIELYFLIAILVSFYLIIQNFNPRYLKATLSFTLFLLIASLLLNINQTNSRQLIVYNTPKNLTVQLIYGKKNFIISKDKIETNENILNLIKTTNCKLKLESPSFFTSNDTLTSKFLLLKNGTLIFEGKIISFNYKNTNLPSMLSPHLIINSNQFSDLKKNISTNTQIITNKRFIPKNNSLFSRIHQTSKQGAFIEKW